MVLNAVAIVDVIVVVVVGIVHDMLQNIFVHPSVLFEREGLGGCWEGLGVL